MTIKEFRIMCGLSQKELAELTGIDQSDLSKIERGVANPSIGTLSRIAEAMNAELMVSIKWFSRAGNMSIENVNAFHEDNNDYIDSFSDDDY